MSNLYNITTNRAAIINPFGAIVEAKLQDGAATDEDFCEPSGFDVVAGRPMIATLSSCARQDHKSFNFASSRGEPVLWRQVFRLRNAHFHSPLHSLNGMRPRPRRQS